MLLREIQEKYNLPKEKLLRELELARRSMAPKQKDFAVIEYGKENIIRVIREGVGPLETEYGSFFHFNFKIADKWEKYSAIVLANLNEKFQPEFKNDFLLIRIDSGCETGQLFGDKTCECKEQLMLALETISRQGEGMLINIPRQDGRGMGLPFKLATLRLQTFLGVDTVEASAMMDPNGQRDIRTYTGVIAILKFFLITPNIKIKLMTNNPKKMEIFKENNYTLGEYSPIVIPPTEHTLRHLKAKQNGLGHINLIDKE